MAKLSQDAGVNYLIETLKQMREEMNIMAADVATLKLDAMNRSKAQPKATKATTVAQPGAQTGANAATPVVAQPGAPIVTNKGGNIMLYFKDKLKNDVEFKAEVMAKLRARDAELDNKMAQDTTIAGAKEGTEKRINSECTFLWNTVKAHPDLKKEYEARYAAFKNQAQVAIQGANLVPEAVTPKK